jgi:4-amino-4-deoxy-L-arabinose transferase-like glycosyltransferase
MNTTASSEPDRGARLVLGAALLLFVIMHLYYINAPPNGYHQWRESDTAAVSLNYYQENLPFLTPRTMELESSSDRANMEFPIYCYLTSLAYHVIGPSHVAGHLVILIAACGCIWLLYLIVKRLHGERVAAYGAYAFSMSPLFSFYSYKMMPDILMLLLMLAAIYLMQRYLSSGSLLPAMLSVAALGLAACIKPLALSVYPALVWLAWREKGRTGKTLVVTVYPLLAATPLALWILTTGWLTGRVGHVFDFCQYLFSLLFFKKIFLQWPSELWIGWVMVPAFAIGLWQLVKRRQAGFYGFWVLSGLVLLALLARYSRQHDYYSLIMVVPLAIVSGYGLQWLYESGRWRRNVVILLMVLAPLGVVARIHTRFGSTDEFYEVRTATEVIIPRSSKVVVEDVTRGAVRLYQMNRKGWYIRSNEEIHRIQECVDNGAQFLVLQEELDEETHAALMNLAPALTGRLGSMYCYLVTRESGE